MLKHWKKKESKLNGYQTDLTTISINYLLWLFFFSSTWLPLMCWDQGGLYLNYDTFLGKEK